MATNTRAQDEGLTIKVPQTLTLKDLITIVSVAVSLTLAWGVFSTRMTVVEKEMVTLQSQVKQQQADIEALRKENAQLDARARENVLFIDQLFTLQKRSPPRRMSQ